MDDFKIKSAAGGQTALSDEDRESLRGILRCVGGRPSIVGAAVGRAAEVLGRGERHAETLRVLHLQVSAAVLQGGGV
ncbi:hypothetical protein [Nocardioides limicola]|uniref:hypothetical protein n=1 Tax=Nocardioides limicola TaxID=2803368 RepID=UPI00193AF67E|nr:hypothetical protein [Nocardioides sp. DJM-14]